MKAGLLISTLFIGFSAYAIAPGEATFVDSLQESCEALKSKVQVDGSGYISSAAGTARYVKDKTQCKSDESVERGFILGTKDGPGLCEVGFVCMKDGEVVDAYAN